MQRGWIKIRAIRPDKCMHFRIQTHLIEQCWITQWSEELTRQDRLKVDQQFSVIVEPNAQHVRTFDLEGLYTIDGVYFRFRHTPILCSKPSPVPFFLDSES